MAEPLACRRNALSKTQRARHQTLAGEIRAEIAEVEELPDGYALRVPARPFLFLRIAEWTELERLCCPFLDIRVAFESERGRIRVALTGPDGAKAVLAAELSILEIGRAAG